MGAGIFSGRRLRIFKQEVWLLFFAMRHPATPLLPKVFALLTVFYLVSPLDIIPDFIPFLGYIDDLVIVPFLVSTAVKLLPMEVKHEGAVVARKQARRFTWLLILAIVLVVALMVLLFLSGRALVHQLLY